MKRRGVLAAVVLFVAIDGTAVLAQDVGEMLAAFVEDYRHDPMAVDAYFGVKVGEDGWWTVRARRRERSEAAEDGSGRRALVPHQVTLTGGEPSEPTWYFDFADATVLKRIHEGTLSAGTAYTRSFETERTALNASTMDGYHSDFEDLARAYHLLSHFWTTGIPEVTRFERDRGMPVHGAAMVSLYSMKDKRITWFSIGPDETVNEQPELEWGQTPNLFIFTSGRGRAEFADRTMDVEEGMSVFIAPYVKHVISNPHDEPLEGILVLFGDNSAFTGGTSYVGFTEDLYEFYGDYEYRE